MSAEIASPIARQPLSRMRTSDTAIVTDNFQPASDSSPDCNAKSTTLPSLSELSASATRPVDNGLLASPLSATSVSSDEQPSSSSSAMIGHRIELDNNTERNDDHEMTNGEAEVLRPTWTTQWTSRAPPPRPLKTLAAASTSAAGGQRRHHPYASAAGSTSAQAQLASSRPLATPSPTWPAHIGLEDRDGSSNLGPSTHPPSDANHLQAHPRPLSASASSASPRRLHGRDRANTLVLPPPESLGRRPPGLTRNSSYGLAGLSRDRSFMHAPSGVMTFDIRRRSRGDSIVTSASSSAESHQSTMPPSPLLFAPITPLDGSFPGSTKGVATPERQASHWQRPTNHFAGQVPPMVLQRQPGFSPLGYESPAIHDNGSPKLPYGAYSPYQAPPSMLENHRRSLQLGHSHPLYNHSPKATETGKRHSESWHDQSSNDSASAPQPQLERFNQTRKRRRPPYSYSSLIAQAITSTPHARMTLREIYTWISKSYPELYSMDGPDSQGWQNTVRHNLSLNKSFVKVARTAQDIYESCASADPAHSQAARGKGGWWTIDPVIAAAQLGPNFRGLENQPQQRPQQQQSGHAHHQISPPTDASPHSVCSEDFYNDSPSHRSVDSGINTPEERSPYMAQQPAFDESSSPSVLRRPFPQHRQSPMSEAQRSASGAPYLQRRPSPLGLHGPSSTFQQRVLGAMPSPTEAELARPSTSVQTPTATATEGEHALRRAVSHNESARSAVDKGAKDGEMCDGDRERSISDPTQVSSSGGGGMAISSLLC